MAQYVSILTVSWRSVFSKKFLKQWKENLLEPLPLFSTLTKIVHKHNVSIILVVIVNFFYSTCSLFHFAGKTMTK